VPSAFLDSPCFFLVVCLCVPAGRLTGSLGLLKKGGLLLVASTFCWSERTAASQLWLGGTADAQGNPVRCAGAPAARLRRLDALTHCPAFTASARPALLSTCWPPFTSLSCNPRWPACFPCLQLA
jgi:hypothetical protein